MYYKNVIKNRNKNKKKKKYVLISGQTGGEIGIAGYRVICFDS